MGPNASLNRVLFVSAVVTVTVIAIAGMAVGAVVAFKTGRYGSAAGANVPTSSATSNGPVGASTPVTTARGTILFSDQFRDSTSGWSTGASASGTTYSYSSTGYVIVAKGSLHHFALVPYAERHDQLSMAITATQSADAPTGAGFGVACEQGSGAGQIRYEFILEAGGKWFLERADGNIGVVLKQGVATSAPGGTPVTLVAMCATLSDAHTTRLVMFVDEAQVVDVRDAALTLPGVGWRSDIDISSRDTRPSTVTVTRLELRDISR